MSQLEDVINETPSSRRSSLAESLKSAMLSHPQVKTGKWKVLKQAMHTTSCEKYENDLLQDKENPVALQRLAKEYVEKECYFDAAVLLEMAVLKYDKTDWHFWQLMSKCCYHLAMNAPGWTPFARFFISKAHYSLTKSLSFIENLANPELLCQSAHLAFLLGRFGLASSILLDLRSKISRFQSESNINLLLCQTYLRIRNYSAALTELTYFLEQRENEGQNSEPQDNPKQKAREQYTLEELENLKLFCEDQVNRQSNPKHPCHDIPYESLATKCLQLQDFVFATLLFTAALVRVGEKDQAALLYNRSLANMGINQIRDAQTDLTRSIEVNPQFLKPVEAMEQWKVGFKCVFTKRCSTPVEEIVEFVQKNTEAAKDSLRFIQPIRAYIPPRSQRQQQQSTENGDAPVVDLSLTNATKTKPSDTPAFNLGELPRLELESLHFNEEPRIATPRQETKQEIARRKLDHIHRTHNQSIPAKKHSRELPPESDNVENRRSRSTFSLKRLGYAESSSYVQYWESLLTTALDLYETRAQLKRAIAKVMSANSKIKQDEAYCALAESSGCIDVACGKVGDAEYFFEVQNICGVIDVQTYIDNKQDDRIDIFPAEAECLSELPGRSRSPTRLRRMHSTCKSSTRTIRGSIDDEISRVSSITIPSIEIGTQGALVTTDYGALLSDKKPENKSMKAMGKTSARALEDRLCSPKKTSIYRLNSLIDDSIAAKAAQSDAECLTVIDKWGSPDRVGSSYRRGTDHNLYTPLQLSMKSFDDAVRFSR